MRAVPFTALLLLAACADPAADLSQPDLAITASPQVTYPGDSITIELVNHSDLTLAVNTCVIEVQRSGVAGWSLEYAEPDSVHACYMSLFPLSPGDSTSRVLVIPENLGGYFRVYFPLLFDMGGGEVPADLRVSQPFEVQQRPPATAKAGATL